MTAPASLLVFALTCAIVEITPGPNMAWLAALSLSRGWRIGLAAVAGVALGLSAYGIAAALGVAAVIENSAFLYEALRWGGVAYLLWLAWVRGRLRTALDLRPGAATTSGARRFAAG